MWKNEDRTLDNTIYKNKPKMDLRPKCKTGYHKTPRGKLGRTLFHINCSNIFFFLIYLPNEVKAKINTWDLIKRKSFCIAK